MEYLGLGLNMFVDKLQLLGFRYQQQQQLDFNSWRFCSPMIPQHPKCLIECQHFIVDLV